MKIEMPEDPISPFGDGLAVATDDDPFDIQIHISDSTWLSLIPESEPLVVAMAKAAMLHSDVGVAGLLMRSTELSVELADDARVAALNMAFRGKAGSTNVLSFPAFEGDELEPTLQTLPAEMPVGLGDLILASGVVEREAQAQGKTLADHVSHLVVHGVLHCLGYDHMNEDEAEEMEALERRILGGFGISDPYQDHRDQKNSAAIKGRTP
ncbi:endoribonuclease YbeY [Iodidimonas gelatinilytica]|uniref:Endoribonuclease YbeY n=2 Tax=Iodidimonas gelatinilytica TaxID=1236966 RepID=A0A5A7N2B2_9PROT|nr:endoribonuclease YbeY [Iodidimonas gelatinilytica]GER02127.1 endoribonuclease YbeY [Iodidimonas gelatinilytica]